MESQIIPMPAGPNEEDEASSPEEEVLHERPNNQFVSYHRTITDGSYVGVHLSSPGFYFGPTEEELIKDYLNRKIDNQPVEYIHISDVDVYKHNPEELAENNQSFGKDEWYFFSSRDRKYLRGNRPDRAAGNGYWRAAGVDKKLYDNDVCIGSTKPLVFYEGKHPNGTKTNWNMREYVANQPRRQPQSLNDMRLDDCVLCFIYKKNDQPRQKNIQVQPPNLPMQPQNQQAGQDTLNMAGDDHNVARQIPDLNFAPDSSINY